MKLRALACVVALLAGATTVSMAANAKRNWMSGKLVETERSKELTGSRKMTNTDSSAKRRGDNGSYSKNSTSTTTDNYDTFQTYKIEEGQKIYVAREQLLFPWSKPADVSVGEPVKYAIEKGKLYLVGDDGKEHKATLVKTSLKPEN